VGNTIPSQEAWWEFQRIDLAFMTERFSGMLREKMAGKGPGVPAVEIEK
jgi:hypothetical protein